MQKPDNEVTEPALPAWMTQELIQETSRVWSAALGRRVIHSEAIEMLIGVRRLVEFYRRIAKTRASGENVA